MANIFSEYGFKQEMPRDFDECMQTSPIAENLWKWAGRLDLFCKIVFWILTGIFALLFIGAINMGIRGRNAAYAVGTIFSTVLLWAICILLEYFIFHSIALLMGGVASIVQHSKVSANIALLSNKIINKGEETINKESNEKIMNTKGVEVWKCPKCGTENLNSAVYCYSCGQHK